ncbi:hypothetical protein ACJBU6_09210 [Exserohilum turcicum]
MEVKEEPITQLYEHMDEFHKRSVWSDKCQSWYKNGTADGRLGSPLLENYSNN